MMVVLVALLSLFLGFMVGLVAGIVYLGVNGWLRPVPGLRSKYER